jgi:hypothetical protein
MRKLGTLICAIVLTGALTGCVSAECDEPLLDYNGNGKEGDAGDYDIMKSAEQSCMEGY